MCCLWGREPLTFTDEDCFPGQAGCDMTPPLHTPSLHGRQKKHSPGDHLLSGLPIFSDSFAGFTCYCWQDFHWIQGKNSLRGPHSVARLDGGQETPSLSPLILLGGKVVRNIAAVFCQFWVPHQVVFPFPPFRVLLIVSCVISEF